MSPSNEPDDLHVLAGEYVLGTLPMAEREAFEARLANDPELQKAVAAWEERFFPTPRWWSRSRPPIISGRASSAVSKPPLPVPRHPYPHALPGRMDHAAA